MTWNRLMAVGFIALIAGMTFVMRAQSPTPFDPVSLPDAAVLSPENAADMQIVASIPASGFSVVLSPDRAHLFTVHALQSGVWYLNATTFPELQPVIQGIPVGRQSSPLFTADGQIMVTVDGGDVVFYHPGDTTYAIDSVSRRQIGAYALSQQGVLAAHTWELGTTSATNRQLCFFAREGEGITRSCTPQPTPITALTFLGEGSRLLVATQDDLTLLDAESGDMLGTFPYGTSTSRPGSFAVLPGTPEDSLPTALISRDGFVLSVDLQTRMERTFASGAGREVRRIITRPDGAQMMLIVPTVNVPDVLVIDLATKAVLHQNLLFDGVSAAYSPDGTLAYINNDVYETATWQPLREFRGSQHILTFSPDGTLLFVLNTTSDSFEIYAVVSE